MCHSDDVFGELGRLCLGDLLASSPLFIYIYFSELQQEKVSLDNAFYGFTWVYKSLTLKVAWTLWRQIGDLQTHLSKLHSNF